MPRFLKKYYVKDTITVTLVYQDKAQNVGKKILKRDIAECSKYFCEEAYIF